MKNASITRTLHEARQASAQHQQTQAQARLQALPPCKVITTCQHSIEKIQQNISKLREQRRA